VEKSEIVKQPDGKYLVTAGWMAHMLKTRAALLAYISQNCKE